MAIGTVKGLTPVMGDLEYSLMTQSEDHELV